MTEPEERSVHRSIDISDDIERIYDDNIGFVKVQYLNSESKNQANHLSKDMKLYQRHLLKHSFAVELYERVKNLCHLFLFNGVLLCAKHKSSGLEKQSIFQLKWFIPVDEVKLHFFNYIW